MPSAAASPLLPRRVAANVFHLSGCIGGLAGDFGQDWPSAWLVQFSLASDEHVGQLRRVDVGIPNVGFMLQR